MKNISRLKMSELRDPDTGEYVRVDSEKMRELARAGRIGVRRDETVYIKPAGLVEEEEVRPMRRPSMARRFPSMREERPPMFPPEGRPPGIERFRALPAEEGPALPAREKLTTERLEKMFPGPRISPLGYRSPRMPSSPRTLSLPVEEPEMAGPPFPAGSPRPLPPPRVPLSSRLSLPPPGAYRSRSPVRELFSLPGAPRRSRP